jgi:hypothetical protein
MAPQLHWRCRPRRAFPRTRPPDVDAGDCASGEGGSRAAASEPRPALVPAPLRRPRSQGCRPLRELEDAGDAGARASGCGCPARLPPYWRLARRFRARRFRARRSRARRLGCSLQPRPSAAPAGPCGGGGAGCAAARYAVAVLLPRSSPPPTVRLRQARHRMGARPPVPLPAADPSSHRLGAADGGAAAGVDGAAASRPPPRTYPRARRPAAPLPASVPCCRSPGRRSRRAPADRSMDAPR